MSAEIHVYTNGPVNSWLVSQANLENTTTPRPLAAVQPVYPHPPEDSGVMWSFPQNATQPSTRVPASLAVNQTRSSRTKVLPTSNFRTASPGSQTLETQ